MGNSLSSCCYCCGSGKLADFTRLIFDPQLILGVQAVPMEVAEVWAAGEQVPDMNRFYKKMNEKPWQICSSFLKVRSAPRLVHTSLYSFPL